MKTVLYGSIFMLLLFSKGLYAQYSVLEIIDATNGDCNGAINISVDPAGAPHTFEWSDGSSAQNAVDLCPGAYTVTITTVQGCEWQLEGIVDGVGGCYLSGIRLTAEITPHCGQKDLGTITLEISNPSAYSYQWTNGENTYRIEGLTLGTYCVTVTDPAYSGCEVNGCFTVTNEGCGGGGGGLLSINEVSNGMGGNAEYVELLVSGGGNCETVNIGNYIIDDNDGTFSVPGAEVTGISPGHLRFLAGEIWGSVPNGAIILIYNDQDKNKSISLPDDPLDLNQDKVYVLPASHTLLQTSTDAGYVDGGDWSVINLYDVADAMQVRNPDGSYAHGISYGLPSIMNGGPDNLHLRPQNATDIVFSFIDGDFRNSANWSVGNASRGNETPGFANSLPNQAFIDNLCNEGGDGRREFADSGASVKRHEDGWAKFSPNPFKDVINVDLEWKRNDQAELRLFDMLGKLVIDQPIQLEKGYNQFQLNIPAPVISGLYQIALCKGDQILLSQKVICAKSED